MDVVIVWRLDRFARSTSQLWNTLKEFEQHDVDLIVLKPAIDTRTPPADVFTILRAVAEFETELRRGRIRSGMASAKAQGKRVGRKRIPKRKQDNARRLRGKGHTYRAIAELLKISPRTAFTYAQEADNYEAP